MPYAYRRRGRTSYDTFGRVWTSTTPSTESRFAFTGRDFDPESDLYHYRARYYDPATGQFISADPLAFEAGDGNLYRYVANGPTDGTDPSGLVNEGHHWVSVAPSWDLYIEGILTRDELTYFAGRSSGPIKAGHGWGTKYNDVAHPAYSEEVRKQLRLWKDSKDPGAVTAEQIVERFKAGRGWDNTENPTLAAFNEGVIRDMQDQPRGVLNAMDGEGRTATQIRERGMASLKKRGRLLYIVGAVGGILQGADAFAQGREIAEILENGEAMENARRAAARGQTTLVRQYLTGVGHPEPSLYEEFQEVNRVFAEGFRAFADPRLEQLETDAQLIQYRLRSLESRGN
jgi:RHS repeat-associated protein